MSRTKRLQSPVGLAAADTGPFLFSEGEIDRLTKDLVPEATYSAEELRAKNPEIYAEVTRLLALGISKRAIQRTFRLHFYTVQAVENQQAATIEALRVRLGRKAFDLASILMESLESDVIDGRLKPEHKSFAINTLIEKAQVLSGGATSRVEIGEAPEKSSYQDWIESAKQAAVVEIPGKTDSLTPAADAVSPGSGILTDRGERRIPTGSDFVSDISAPSHTVTPSTPTTEDTESEAQAADSAGLDRGGEGGQNADRGGQNKD